jgi:S1-C subfamily serine protease
VLRLTITAGLEAGTSVEVDSSRFVIGRGDDCDLVVDDEKVSRHHAALERSADGVLTISDLGSSNGTFVNARRITEPVTLHGGEHLRVGDTAIVFSLDDPEPDPDATKLAPAMVESAAGTQPEPTLQGTTTPPLGRSTIARIIQKEVHEEVAAEERDLRRTTRLAVVLAAVAVAAAAAIAALFATGTIGGSSSSQSSSVTRLERATVLISGLDEKGEVAYIGSGSIVRADGYILTNAHVGKPSAPGLAVQYGVGQTEPDPARLEVSLFQGEAKPAKPVYIAKPVAYDGYVDAAVLRIVSTLDGKPVGKLDLPTVPIGDSDRLRDGEPVTVVGYPGVGGGFEGEINVSRGTVSGFQKDPHIGSVRGWIKTDAAIAHGNSGGLAADSKGRLIGIPSRFQCGSSLFVAGCNSSDDKQGKIRPINLALPIVKATEAGRSWKDPYLVPNTGHERFTLLHFAAHEPDNSCNYRPVTSYPAGAPVYAVFRVSGLAGGEDLALVTAYRASATSSPSVDETLESWSKSYGPSSPCYWISIPTGQGNGTYSLQIFAGPSLVKASNEVNVRVGT